MYHYYTKMLDSSFIFPILSKNFSEHTLKNENGMIIHKKISRFKWVGLVNGTANKNTGNIR